MDKKHSSSDIPPCEAVIFDMDGTLLDTLEDIADSMNAAIAKFGFPPHGLDAYRAYVGDGLEMLAYRVIPEQSRDEKTVAQCVAAMRAIYRIHYADKSIPYDGIPELLDALSSRGIKMTILSNKLDEFTKEMAEKLLASWKFEVVSGITPRFPAKPDPASAIEISKTLNIKPDKIFFIGDTSIDMTTATRAGMFPVGVLWGFRDKKELIENGAKLLLAHPLDFVKYLQER
jgi:phosphoglycolate phosphatase